MLSQARLETNIQKAKPEIKQKIQTVKPDVVQKFTQDASTLQI